MSRACPAVRRPISSVSPQPQLASVPAEHEHSSVRSLGFLPTDSGQTFTDIGAQGQVELLESDEPLPAPLLIDGGTLKRNRWAVARPLDPKFDGDDIFDGIFSDIPPLDIPDISQEHSASIVIFADPSVPFGGVILGLELLEGGGFRPWAANLDGRELTDLTKHLEQVDGSWSMSDTSELVEVARFQDDFFDSMKFGWQFDFQLAGADEITIQAESTEAGNSVDEWLWIARLAKQEGTDASVRPVRILGQDGYVIDVDDQIGDSGVVWASDGFVYRMTATRLEDNTSFGRDSTGEIGRLRVASRREWVNAIAVSVGTSATEWIIGTFGLLVAAALLISTVFFLVKRSFRPAALAAITLTFSLFFVSSPTYFGTVVLIALGLGLAWWLHRTSSSKATQLLEPN